MDQNMKKDKSGELAALVSFCVNSDKFSSNYNRNKFYRGLYGWKQVIKKDGKKYAYQREGLMDKIPNLKVDKSVYIVPLQQLHKVKEYMDKWGSKIDYKTFRVLLEPERFKKIRPQKNKISEEWTEIPIK